MPQPAIQARWALAAVASLLRCSFLSVPGIAVSSMFFLHVWLTWPLSVPHKRCEGRTVVQQRSMEVKRQTDAE